MRIFPLFLVFSHVLSIWQRGNYTILSIFDDGAFTLSLGGALNYSSSALPGTSQVVGSGVGPWGAYDEVSFLDSATKTQSYAVRYHLNVDAFTFLRAAQEVGAFPFFNESVTHSSATPLIFYTNDYMVPGYRSTLSACASGPTPQYTDGALFLFSASASPGGLHPALIFSPLDNFTTQSALCTGGAPPYAGFGAATGEACVGWPCSGRSYTPLPPPTAMPFSSILLGRPSLKRATMAWGALLRQAHNTTRARGTGTRALSYVSSNAAGYSFWSEPRNLTVWGVPEDIFAALHQGYAALGVPVRQYEVDTQFPMEMWPGDGWCFKEWGNWSATLFPSGPLALVASLGNASMMYYVQGFCRDNVYGSSGNWRFVSVGGNPRWEPPASVIHPDDAYAFYTSILKPAVQWNMQHLFADFTCMRGPRLAQNLPAYYGAEAVWMQGFTSAAADLGMETQFCMSCAHQALASLTLPSVTNFRASNDGGMDPTELVFSSILISAVGAGWSKDNLRLAAWGPGTTELQTLLAALSLGPVQLGDVLQGFPAYLPKGSFPGVNTNVTLAMSTCTANGTLLQPSFPLTPIEPLLVGGEGGLDVTAGHVLATLTTVPTVAAGAAAASSPCAWYTAIGYTATAASSPSPPPFALLPRHLAPLMDAEAPAPSDFANIPRGAYLESGDELACDYVVWNPALPVTLAHNFSSSSPALLPLTYAVPTQLNFAPILPPSNVVLLGEAGKAAAVSSFRFSSVAPQGPSLLGIGLRGAPLEELVLLWLLLPSLEVHSTNLTLNASGALETVLQGRW